MNYANANARWWRTAIEKTSNVHDAITGHAKALQAHYRPMHIRDRVHERIYRNSRITRGARYAPALHHLAALGWGPARLSPVQSVVNTAVAKLGKRRPMPSVVVDDADWKIKRQSRKVTRFIKGKLRETEFDRESPLVLRDACIKGTGLMKIAASGGGIIYERTHKEEILVDPREARYGKPRQLIQVKPYAREVLADLYPRHKEQIWNAPPSEMRWYYEEDEDYTGADWDNMVDVYEAWHLASGDGADDGRRAIVIATATLEYEPWDSPRFPFARFHWDPPQRGFWGHGIPELVGDMQFAMNRIVDDVQANMSYAGRLIVFTRRGSNVPTAHLTGLRPHRIEYDGAGPPEYHVPDAVSPQQIQMLEFWERKMFDYTGVSQAQASSRSDLAPDASGRAHEIFYDIQTERFALQEANYANFRLDCGQLFVDAAMALKRQSEKSKDKRDKLTFSWSERGKRKSLDWLKDAPDVVELELEPVNFVPDTRAGKLAAAEQLAAAGVIEKDMAPALFDEPDIERANRIRNAPYNNLERIMESLADEDIDLADIAPHPYLDLKLAQRMSVAYLNRMENEGAPEEVLERYRTWIDMLKEISTKEAPADGAQPGAMPADGAMPGAPMPPGPMPGAPMDPAAMMQQPMPPEAMATAPMM